MSPFYRIVSNLSLSPSAGSQLGYYARRLKKENTTRKFSAIMGAALILLQVAIVAAPPAVNAGTSGNDIIAGGIGTSKPKTNLLKAYDDKNNKDVKALFNHYGIDRNDIDKTKTSRVSSGTGNEEYVAYSLGRLPHSSLDTPIKINGTTFYERPLYTWGKNVRYNALHGTANGRNFYVLYNCGNLTIFKKKDGKTVTPPKLNVTKAAVSPAAETAVAPGATLTYKVNFTNTGGAAQGVVIGDRISNYTTYVSQSGLDTADKGGLKKQRGNRDNRGKLPAGYYTTFTLPTLKAGGKGSFTVTVKVRADTPNGARVCDTAFIDYDKGLTDYSQEVCHIVKKPITSKPTPQPTQPTTTTAPETPQEVVPETPNTPEPIKPVEVSCDVTGTCPQPGITLSKKAVLTSASTGAKTDANGATAQPGDTITYTLSTANSGTGDAASYIVTEPIADVLEYATLTNDGGGNLNATTGTLSWPAKTIKAGTTQTNTFSVKIKSPIPTTGVGKSDPQSYDLKMDNLYGNLVTTNLEAPAAKEVEEVAAELPETGATSTTLVVFGMIGIVMFFYFRNRQLMTEVKLLRGEFYGRNQ